MALATSRHQHSGNGGSEGYHTHQRLSSTVGGWCPGLVAPERMHGPGPKELPDVCPSGAPNEFANSRADASIERSMNKRGRGLRWKEEGGH